MVSKRTLQRRAADARDDDIIRQQAANHAAEAEADAIARAACAEECPAVVHPGGLAIDFVPFIRELAAYRIVKSPKDGCWSVYLRNFNVRIATISASAPTFRIALTRLCDAAALAEKFETKKEKSHATNHKPDVPKADVRRRRAGL